jgi:hypothetical protein
MSGGDRKPMVLLTTVWERVSQNGNRYFSGYLGNSQLLMFDDGEQPHPTKPGETVHVWKVLLQERDQAQRPQASPTRNAEHGQRTWDRSRDAAQRMQEPPQSWIDDSEGALRDLEFGPGR